MAYAKATGIRLRQPAADIALKARMPPPHRKTVHFRHRLCLTGKARDIPRPQKRAGVKSFMRLTQNLKLYMRQQVSSFLGCFAEVRLRGLGAT